MSARIPVLFLSRSFRNPYDNCKKVAVLVYGLYLWAVVTKDNDIVTPCGDKFLKPHKSSSSSISGV